MSYTYEDQWIGLTWHYAPEPYNMHNYTMTTLIRVPATKDDKKLSYEAQQSFIALCTLLYKLKVIEVSAFQ